MAGLTDTGFEAKTLEEILAEIEQRQRDDISPALNQSAASVIGQLNAIYADRERRLWELAQALYSGFDPSQATGDAFERIAEITGTFREGATKSTVDCTVNVDDGFSAVAGDMVAHVDGDPDARFVNAEAVSNTSGAAADLTVPFEAEDTGPVRANAGTLTVIASPLAGWNSVTNPLDATLGEVIEPDSDMRPRREDELAQSSSTLQGVRSAVLDLEGIDSVTALENDTSKLDANQLPPKSFEMIVFDGTGLNEATPVVTDDDIAQSILDVKPSGMLSHGNTSGQATDIEGNVQGVGFTRPVKRSVWIDLTVDVNSDYEGDTALKESIVDWAAENLGPGDDVIEARLHIPIFEVQGVVDVVSLTLGFSSSPTGTDNLQIAIREVADFDTSRITVVS